MTDVYFVKCALARQRPRFGMDLIHRLRVKRDGQVKHKRVHVSGREKTCKSLENSIADAAFQAAARTAACVVE